jgi:hypothetical protein
MRGRRVRRLHLAGTAAALAVLLASCSSSPSSPSAGSKGSGHTTTTDATSATTAPATPSTLAPVATAGPLTPGAPIALPFTASAVTAAESPDGAVFVSPEDPTSPAPTVTWVVDGNGPAEIAEHISGGVAAMAADGTNFYVATYNNVFAFDRASGNQSGQWNLPPLGGTDAAVNDLVSMTAAGGNVYISIAQVNMLRIYRIEPASSAAPHLLLTALSAAIGSDGTIYYESGDHHLDALRPDGSTTQGPALVDKPNGLGGGVQDVDTVAGGYVWVAEPAGQGLDAGYTTYATTTLAEVATFSGSVTDMVADTAAGPLVLEQGATAGSASCPQGTSPTSCLFRIDQQGATSDPVPVGAAVSVLGPGPAVIASNTTTDQFELVRLS